MLAAIFALKENRREGGCFPAPSTFPAFPGKSVRQNLRSYLKTMQASAPVAPDSDSDSDSDSEPACRRLGNMARIPPRLRSKNPA